MFDPLETNEGGLVADFYLARKKERKENGGSLKMRIFAELRTR